jgi:type I restriction enzyme S subunit
VSRIDDLIAELCPDGVELRALGEVGQFVRGNGLQKKDFVEEGVGCIHYGQIYTLYGTSTTVTKSFVVPELAHRLRKAQPGDLIVATTSENDEDVCKAVAWLGASEVAVSGDAYVYSHTLDPLYAAYFFQSDAFQAQKKRYITGTKVKRVSGADLARIRAQVPPMAIQCEIVAILSEMEALEAQLAVQLRAEREARRQQYVHHRASLFAFEPRQRVRWMALGSVAEVRAGWGFPKKHQGQLVGAYPFFKVSDMNLPGNEKRMFSANNYVDEATARSLGCKPAPAGTVLFPKIGAAIATNKKRMLVQPSCYDNNVFGIIPLPVLNPRFLLHYLQTLDLSVFAHHSGAVPSIRKSTLDAHRIPLLPLGEQDRIGGILDRLEASTDELSSCLSDEARGRRRQYGRYRDRLFAFEPATA